MAEQPALVQAAATRLPFPQGQFNLSLTAPSPSAPVQRFLLLLRGSAGVRLQCSPSYKAVEVRKQVSKLALGDMAVLCRRAGDVSHAAEGGTSDHAAQPRGISLSQPQVTKAQKYVGFTCFGLHLRFEPLLARASVTLGTGVIPLTAFLCQVRLPS